MSQGTGRNLLVRLGRFGRHGRAPQPIHLDSRFQGLTDNNEPRAGSVSSSCRTEITYVLVTPGIHEVDQQNMRILPPKFCRQERAATLGIVSSRFSASSERLDASGDGQGLGRVVRRPNVPQPTTVVCQRIHHTEAVWRIDGSPNA